MTHARSIAGRRFRLAVIAATVAAVAAAAQARTVRVLDVATPGVDRASIATMIDRLKANGVDAAPITADELATRPLAKDVTLVLPDATNVPARLAEPLDAFCRAGGDVVFVGPRPLSSPRAWVGGAWRTRDEAGAALADAEPGTTLLSFDGFDPKAWKRDSNAPAAASMIAVDRGVNGDAAKLDIRSLAAWDTFATRLPKPIPDDHRALTLWARGDAATPELALECRTHGGARWIATVPLTQEWARRVVADRDFAYHSGGDVKPGQRLRLADVETITLGLARGFTKQTVGDHAIWVDELTSSPLVVPTPKLFEAFALSTTASSYAPRTADAFDGPGGSLRAAKPVSFVPTFSIPRYRQSVAQPLLAADGKPIASIFFNDAGPFAGSNWLAVGASLADARSIDGFDRWLAGAINDRLHASSPPELQPKVDPRVALGVTHASGKYRFEQGDFLNEGAAKLKDLGTRSIKLWMNNVEKAYPFGTQWPAVRNLTELAQTAPFRRVFADDFDTYFLVAFSSGMPHGYFKEPSASDAQFAEDERQFYDLTKHLLTAYRGTNKTFVLQSWEGDWLVRPQSDINLDPSPEAIRGMIRFFNARQRGVDRARAEVGEQGVRVRHAAEVNQVKRSLFDGRRNIVDTVLPFTNVDLASYSAYDSQQDPAAFRASLEHLAASLKPKPGIDGCRVYVGEYGIPETSAGLGKVQRTLPQVVDIALAFGCPYVLYWELYCNENINTPVVKNDDTKGYWLIKPDGTKAWAWDFLSERLKEAR